MAHLRTQIRQTLANAIEAKGMVAKGKVYQSRTHPHETDSFPVIEVSTPSDKIIGNVSDAPKIYRRSLTVMISCIAKGVGAEDKVNDLADQIEALILPDHSLSGLAEDVDLENTEVEIDGKGAQCHAEAELTFVVMYITEHPFIVTDDFIDLHADWDLANPDGQIDAQDDITLEQT